MSVKILLDSNLMERRDLRSGRIYKPDHPPKYGALYTSHKNVLEDDFGLIPAQLLGAYIGNYDVPETETNKFLKIVGGYFYHDKYPDQGFTTKVFGVALDPEFGITENGTTIIHDSWDHADYPKRFLDEGRFSQEFGPHHGWTFITEFAEKDQFPRSYTPLKIFASCPDIKSVQAKVGDCVYDDEHFLKRKVSFKADLAETPIKWQWNFGDSENHTGEGAIPDQVDHLYGVNPAIKPKLTVWFNPACEGISKEAELPPFKVCPSCPQIEDVEIKIGDCELIDGVRQRNVTFIPKYSGDEPDGWILFFGDGEEQSGDGFPPKQIIHAFTKTPTEPAWLRMLGPNPCEAVKHRLDLSGIEECPPCPEIIQLEYIATDETPAAFTIQFTAELSGAAPDTFEWNFCDGSPVMQTAEGQATHTFQKANADTDITILLETNGPGKCKAQKSLTITIPAKTVCPKIKNVQVEIGDCETTPDGRRRKVAFKPQVTGVAPNHWTLDFGDGNSQTKDGAVPAIIEHYYFSKPIEAAKLSLVVPLLCEPAEFTIPLDFGECKPCPVITDLVVSAENTSETTTQVTGIVQHDGRQPESIEWNWGDGSSTEVTSELTASHTYTRPQNAAANYSISIKSNGPEDCSDTFESSVTIDVNAQLSWMERNLRYIITFLASLSIGSFLLRLAADFFKAQTNYWWLSLVVLFVGVVTFLSIIYWVRISQTEKMKKERKNAWPAMLGFAGFSAFLVAIYIQPMATAGWWWFLTLLLPAVGIYFIYHWIIKSKPGTKKLLFYLAACFLAAFINTLIFTEIVF